MTQWASVKVHNKFYQNRFVFTEIHGTNHTNIRILNISRTSIFIKTPAVKIVFTV